MSIDIATEIELTEELILDADTAAALFLEARTANAWTDEEISDETLQAVYALTRMGPTAMNIQPLRIAWVRSTEARERLVEHMSDGNKAKTLTAPMTAILSFTNEWHQLLPTTAPHMAKMPPNDKRLVRAERRADRAATKSVRRGRRAKGATPDPALAETGSTAPSDHVPAPPQLPPKRYTVSEPV